MSDVNDQPQGEPDNRPASGGITISLKALNWLLYSVLAITIAWLGFNYLKQEGLISFGGPTIAVVDMHGVVEDYRRNVLDSALEGEGEEVTSRAMKQAEMALSQLEWALAELNARHGGDLVLMQKQALAYDGSGSVLDLTGELRSIIMSRAGVVPKPDLEWSGGAQ